MNKAATTASYWQQHFAAQPSSGLNLTRYLKKHSLKFSQWYYWKKKIDTKSSKSLKLIPVTLIKNKPTAPVAPTCRVHLPNGIVVELSDYLNPISVIHQLHLRGAINVSS